MEKLGFKLVSMWDEGAIGGGLARYATALAPHKVCGPACHSASETATRLHTAAVRLSSLTSLPDHTTEGGHVELSAGTKFLSSWPYSFML